MFINEGTTGNLYSRLKKNGKRNISSFTLKKREEKKDKLHLWPLSSVFVPEKKKKRKKYIYNVEKKLVSLESLLVNEKILSQLLTHFIRKIIIQVCQLRLFASSFSSLNDAAVCVCMCVYVCMYVCVCVCVCMYMCVSLLARKNNDYKQHQTNVFRKCCFLPRLAFATLLLL